MTITVGIDLATEPAGTAFASIDWSGERPKVTQLCSKGNVATGGEKSQKLNDAALVDLITRTLSEGGTVGIDCPFGWPDSFRTLLDEHARDDVEPPKDEGDGNAAWRRQQAYRETDFVAARLVAERKNLTQPLEKKKHRPEGNMPLSPAADRLCLTTMRLAAILAGLRKQGVAVDRADLSGPIVEVYPAASLALWDLPNKGYKDNTVASIATRKKILGRILAAVDMNNDFIGRCEESDDALDAVISALSARAAQLGEVSPVPSEHHDQATREGWIALPTCGLDHLATQPATDETPAIASDATPSEWQVPLDKIASDLDPWSVATLTCKQCGWSGLGNDASHELFDYLLQVDCPECGGRLLLVTFPTGEQIRAEAAKGNPMALARLPVEVQREEFFARVQREKLRDPALLPDLDGDVLDFVLTLDDDNRLVLLHDTNGRPVGSGWGPGWNDVNPEGIQAGQPGVLTLHTEAARNEDTEPVWRIMGLLEARYGERFRYLDPWEAASWLMGDELFIDATGLDEHAKPTPPSTP